jgi:hypothetical protein
VNKWITIITVDLPVDAQLIRSILEMEGIDASIPDEYTTDVAPFYSQAIGGIRVLVAAQDFNQAHSILTENGYLKAESTRENKVLNWINKKTLKLPIIKHWRSEVRILSFVIAVLALIITPIVFLSQPTFKEQIICHIWCLTKATFKGKDLRVINSQFKITLNTCEHLVNFYTSGKFDIPKFEGAAPIVSWGEYGKGIYVHVDSSRNNAGLATFLEGEYEVFQKGVLLEVKKDDVILRFIRLDLTGF